MRKLKLSNGWTINVFVGDGFDGGSGIYFEPPKSVEGHTLDPQHVQVPKKDAIAVAKLLHWYAMKELALRLYEGTVFGLSGVVEVEHVKIGNSSDPYQALFFAGACLKLGRKAGKAKCFPIKF